MSARGILDADMGTVLQWVRSGARWWVGELAAMVPQALRKRPPARSALADYLPDTGEIRAPATDRAAIGTPVTVVLPADFCLTRIIERPVMSRRDMENMIALESGRIMPMAPGEAILAGRILARDESQRRMEIEVAAVTLAAAARLGEVLARLGRPCTAVLAGASEPGGPAPINLLPALRRAGLVGRARSLAGPLWACVALLFAVNLGLLVWRDVAATESLQSLVDEQQPAVDAARHIRGRIAQTDRVVGTTLARRRNGEPLALLARIDSALPPGVWLQRFAVQPDGLRVVGYRPASADVSAALRRAGLAVVRYSDTSAAEQNQLGQPFEMLLQLGRR